MRRRLRVQRLPVDGVRRLPVDGVQRLPVVDAVAPPVRTRVGRSAILNRPPCSDTPPAFSRRVLEVVDTGTAPRVAQRSVDAGTAPHPRAGDAADVAASPAASAVTTSVPTFGGTSEAGSPSTAVVVQRSAPPAVRPAAARRHESPTAPVLSDPPVTPVVQRVPSGGRLVVLPPVRSSTTSDGPVTRRMGWRARSSPKILARCRCSACSSTPQDLPTTHPAQRRPARGQPDPATRALPARSRFPQYPSSANRNRRHPPGIRAEPCGGSHRDRDGRSIANPQPSGDVEGWSSRLYDPLAAQLRELWLDRERGCADGPGPMKHHDVNPTDKGRTDG